MFNVQDGIFPAAQNFAQSGQALADQFLKLVGQAMSAQQGKPVALPSPDPAELGDLQQRFVSDQARLWQSMLQKGAEQIPGKGAAVPDAKGAAEFRVSPEPGDRRFAAKEWRESPVFDYIQQAYLLNARYLREFVELVPVEEGRLKDRVRFIARQYIDALAPSNFAGTNPEFIRLAVESKGESVRSGVENLIGDFEKGRISMTDESVFEVGKNLATTPGSVIFENELIQLIQYAPTTEKVAKRPFLIVPPCINKYYILDLQPENSFVRFAVEQGHTVFLVSWRNPKEAQAKRTWDDYLEQGPITAIGVVREITKAKQINALGFCVGGTILTSALAVLKARGEDPVASLTLLTTLLDFSDTGEIGLFIDEQSVAAREATIGQGGLLTARELSGTFSALRANDLVWNYVANNYLKGQKPQAFDLLYWNGDNTNLPGPFACWYMRNLYHANNLRVPGKLEMCGVKVDLGKLEMPAYLLATREDHIVPWQTAYQSTRLLGGKTRFVLGASGHIAGVINPAAKNKRSHWLEGNQRSGAEDWLSSAKEVPGSWWTDWAEWLGSHGDGEVAAPKTPGNKTYKVIEPAPGRYVREKA
ncbi:MAG TPA: class I poly(R)-hydroxyalkanoic acid synthase [Rhodocyclaceae bacterium]